MFTYIINSNSNYNCNYTTEWVAWILLSLYPSINFVTARKRSLGQGYVFTAVCHSVHRGEGDLSNCPPMQTPTPEIHGILRDTINKRAVPILLECILVAVVVA